MEELTKADMANFSPIPLFYKWAKDDYLLEESGKLGKSRKGSTPYFNKRRKHKK